jgi:hypothetical protein
MKIYQIIDHPDGGYMISAIIRPHIGLTRKYLRYLDAEKRMMRMECASERNKKYG